MGLHTCTHPCWHRALILCGTVGYWHAAGYITLRYWEVSWLWIPVAWLVSTWLVKHLLQWRCQGREPSDGQRLAAIAVMLGSAALLSRDDD